MVFAFDEAGRMALYYTLNGNGQLRKIVWNGQAASPTPSNLAFAAIAPDARLRHPHRARRHGRRRAVRHDPARRSADARRRRCRRRSSTSPSRTTPGGGSSRPGRRVRCARPRRWSTSCSPGEDVANASVVTLDAEGRFVLHAAMATDVVVDVLGWFSTTPGTASAGRFVPVDPGRLIDTRQPAGAQLPSGSTNAYVEAAGPSRPSRSPVGSACPPPPASVPRSWC